MSPLELQRMARRTPCPSPPAKLVLLVVTTYADSHGYAWPSITTLVTDTGLARRTVQRAVSSLIEAGLLEVAGKGPKGTAVWRVSLEGASQRHGCHADTGVRVTQRHSDQGGRQSDTGRGVTLTPKGTSQGTKEGTTSPQPPSERRGASGLAQLVSRLLDASDETHPDGPSAWALARAFAADEPVAGFVERVTAAVKDGGRSARRREVEAALRAAVAARGRGPPELEAAK